MKISYQHLLKHIVQRPSLNSLSEKLFQLGHEHEVQNDIFDIEFTPNRGDCLSVNGLLRDINVFYDIKLDQDKYENNLDKLDINFINECKDDCTNIAFLKIEIESEIDKYKNDLKDYFDCMDVKKNNFFTDISNYLAYETGQPTHCYDFTKVGKNILLKEINNSVEFETLIGKKILLSGNNLVFSSDSEVINLAGVIGGKNTCCSKNTRSVLVECAYFNSEKIIGKSLKYDIKSDAAYKFERGVDPICHEQVLRRFVSLVQLHANIKSVQYYSEQYKNFTNKTIPYELDSINNIVGLNITDTQYDHYLKKLGFSINKSEIIVPSFRSDISSQNDMAEEIARCIGYDSIPVKPINIINKNKLENLDKSIELKVKKLLIDNGFHEVINFPFSSDPSNKAIKVDNPLDSNKGFLRLNILNSLIENLLFNERRQHDSIKLFEISDTYTIENNIIKKSRKLGIIASGRIARNHKDFSKKIDSDYISSIFCNYINDVHVKMKKISRDKLDTKIKTDIFAMEINIKDINKQVLDYHSTLIAPPLNFQFKKVSDYPKIFRDLSFAITSEGDIERLQNLIFEFKSQYLKDVFIFDYFENSKQGIIKIGFRFAFQSYEKTLTDNDVNDLISDIIISSTKMKGVKIPGLET
tara:strand:+ start:1881 stop:3800 length:1920 start_codon:yes stop_codon:yes gene_type:complete